MKVEDYGATQPVNNSGGGFGSAGATEAVGAGFGGGAAGSAGGSFGGAFSGDSWGSGGATEPVNNAFGGFSGDYEEGTEPPTTPFAGDAAFRNAVADYGEVTQPVSHGQEAGFTPVVGWLVCIEGPDKGSDYRIQAGYNNIGRGENMDICIRGDLQITREKAAVIGYDDQEKVFFFAREASKNTVRLNGKMVMVPTQIHAYDVLTIGASRLIFIPLCGDRFDWK